MLGELSQHDFLKVDRPHLGTLPHTQMMARKTLSNNLFCSQDRLTMSDLMGKKNRKFI